jgi:hypothetical protein
MPPAGLVDIRHLLNGLVDSYLYHSGRIDTTLPFDELRQRSHINEAAQAADSAPDFSQRIRASLPTISPMKSTQEHSRTSGFRGRRTAANLLKGAAPQRIGANSKLHAVRDGQG